MLVNITHDTGREHTRLFVAGVAYLTVVALLIGLSIAIYQKVFTPVTMVTVKADRAGLQLARFGDVRMHGVLVGQIRSITQDGHQAVIKLGLQPSQAREIPDNVSVKILPTTLFGQKYVEFVDPKVPAAQPLTDGTVIPASRVQTSVELESILARLFPLLRSVRPADLDTTLHALATALTGRGNQIGRTMQELDAYLRTMNVHLPTLRTDMRELADVANTYSLAAPDLVRLLRNATTTAHTVTTQQTRLGGFLTDLTTMSDTATRVLSRNGPGIEEEAALAVPLTGLLDTYSPEFPCLLKGLDRYTGRLNQIFRHSRVSQTMILSGDQRPAYGRADRPVYGEVGHGPWCLGLPHPKQGPPLPYVPLKDGTPQDNPPGTAP
ncbi:MCE family protein [Nocardioides terrisoli]|uniref:MCE family protein n=1 Tax=Nocardioides terrisoli TaxID=3388267 RepID=UPI00287B754F|nr:MCE family protein [Nocardioides marmorisolisilvae]